MRKSNKYYQSSSKFGISIQLFNIIIEAIKTFFSKYVMLSRTTKNSLK